MCLYCFLLHSAQTVKLTDHMSAQILSPLPFSPLR
jgi:hypothetical protein